ncbi:hypothetical protein KT99_01624 [Shewanella benthica KT99]|uniref:Uncharacterized protein n=1 Tax=Shewanella benthica KT99 TaxID=314608 RepID=A9DFY5_9GAMM|nr:hypothetical protein KT99_01624 [Shewanella benthica KT99]
MLIKIIKKNGEGEIFMGLILTEKQGKS